MKIIRFQEHNLDRVRFGVVIGDRAVAFSDIEENQGGRVTGYLEDSKTYLNNLPESEQQAKELWNWVKQNFDVFPDSQKPLLTEVKLLEPVEVSSLFDFGLTPRHLQNAGKTILKYESAHPEIVTLLKAFGESLNKQDDSLGGQNTQLSYYKCNMNSIVGDNVQIPWPCYTSRLDIEPELAVVYGNKKQPVAGYCIFNDISARDVQALEVVGGFCRTKDMPNGNQLGPHLVTGDEIGDPYQQLVTVRVNGQVRFTGNTQEISHRAEDVLAWMEKAICPLKSGSIIGLGTIPDCTGLDHDEFLNPGDNIDITFENIGTLRCCLEEPVDRLSNSRWPLRSELRKYVD